MANEVDAQGTVFAIGDGASPEVFNAVGNVTGLSGLQGGQTTVIPVSNLSSTRVEKKIGLPDEGQLQVEVNLKPGETTGQDAMNTARTAKTLKNFRITLSDSPATVFDFAGYVTTAGAAAQVDGVWTRSYTVEITGAVTES